MIKRIRIRSNAPSGLVLSAYIPAFKRFSLVTHRMIDVGAQWPEVFLVLEIIPDRSIAERDSDVTPGAYHSYSLKSVVTGLDSTAYQADLVDVDMDRLDYIIDYYSSALEKFRKARSKMLEDVDQKAVRKEVEAYSAYSEVLEEAVEEEERAYVPRARRGY